MRPQSSPPRGFTLIELAVVLAIISVILGLSISALQAMKTRATFANVSAETAMAVRRARAEAFGRGTPTAFVLDTVGKRWWSLEAPSGVNLDSFDPTNAVFDPARPARLIASGKLGTAASFGPAAGYGVALQAPFAAIPVLSTQAPALPYCSFCRASGTNTGFGAILFTPAGRTTFSGGPAGLGQQFTLTGQSGNATRTVLVAVVERTGAIEIQEK
jgi:prepilin-type N-terminal cleavage/methylation domain-containing protein